MRNIFFVVIIIFLLTGCKNSKNFSKEKILRESLWYDSCINRSRIFEFKKHSLVTKVYNDTKFKNLDNKYSDDIVDYTSDGFILIKDGLGYVCVVANEHSPTTTIFVECIPNIEYSHDKIKIFKAYSDKEKALKNQDRCFKF